MDLRRRSALEAVAGRLVHAQELLRVAGQGLGVRRQVAHALPGGPPPRRREHAVRVIVCHDPRQDAAGQVQAALDVRRRLAEPTLELLAPDVRRRPRVVPQAAPHLEEVPIPLELPLVVPIPRPQQVERRLVVRVVLHLRRQRLVDLETLAVVDVRARGEAADVLGIAPEQHAGRPAVPQPPVHLVPPRIPQQVGVPVPPVALVARVDVRRVKRQAHLLHPVLRGNPNRHAHLDGLVDQRIREILRPRVEPNARGVLLDDLVDVRPEGRHLPAPQARLAVHAELDRVGAVHRPKERRQRGLGVRHEVLPRHAPDQPLRGFLRMFRRPLHAAAIDVVPDPQRKPQPPLPRHPDQPIQRRQVLPLPVLRLPNHPHVAEPRHVDEIRIRRREVPAVLIAKDQHERVEPILRQHVEVRRPIRLVVEPRLEARPVHRIHRQRPLGHIRLLRRLAHLTQRIGARLRPADLTRHLQLGVHQPPIVRSGDQHRRLAARSHALDHECFHPRRRRNPRRLQHPRRRPLRAGQTHHDQHVPLGRLHRRGPLDRDLPFPQRGRDLLHPVRRGRTRLAVRNQRDRHVRRHRAGNRKHHHNPHPHPNVRRSHI